MEAQKSKSEKTPCIYFQKGTCKNKDGCKYSHDQKDSKSNPVK